MNAKRPFGITFLAFLTWINGLLGVMLGMLLLFSDDYTAPGVMPFAIATAAVGVLTILVATGLLHANPMARLIITVLQLLSIVAAGSHIFFTQKVLLADIITIVISLVVLLMLWSRKSNKFFAAK